MVIYTNVKLREFRYDSGRRRYLVRERAVTSPYAPISSQWTDYDGDGPWLDYTLSGAAATAVNEYVAGLAQRIVGESENVYFHGDQALDMQIGATDQTPFQVAAGLKERARQGQVGSTRMVSDAAGLPARRVVYTAFGEPVYADPGGDPGTRYLYAGAWGYENFDDPAFPFLHVGERWYDPSVGRFLQRDRIGISGGLNVYAYVENQPLRAVDPYGEEPVGIAIAIVLTGGALELAHIAHIIHEANHAGECGERLMIEKVVATEWVKKPANKILALRLTRGTNPAVRYNVVVLPGPNNSVSITVQDVQKQRGYQWYWKGVKWQ